MNHYSGVLTPTAADSVNHLNVVHQLPRDSVHIDVPAYILKSVDSEADGANAPCHHGVAAPAEALDRFIIFLRVTRTNARTLERFEDAIFVILEFVRNDQRFAVQFLHEVDEVLNLLVLVSLILNLSLNIVKLFDS